jgi:hypothetical protein
MKYEIKYQQVYTGRVIVEADSDKEAREKAYNEIDSGEDYEIIDTEINLLELNSLQ